MVDYAALIESLSAEKRPFGLLTMQATETLPVLAAAFPDRLRTLFAAEHGFFGAAAAGEKCASARHPTLGLPIHSLYGEHRHPTDEMLAGIDRLVIDLHDIGVRCYTYLATLKNALEACAARGIAVTVLDRPIPLGDIVDGPVAASDRLSFVAPIAVPFCHSMTPGECATWLRDAGGLSTLDLTVIRIPNWNHAVVGPWPGFLPPSPAIVSWDSAVAYPMTVFTEAYPAVDCDRQGPLAFRLLGARWLDAETLIKALKDPLARCGVALRPYRYVPRGGAASGQALDGVLLSVADRSRYLPVVAGTHILSGLLRRYPDEMAVDARPAWLDRLAGTESVRTAVEAGDPEGLFPAWATARDHYLMTKVDLYR